MKRRMVVEDRKTGYKLYSKWCKDNRQTIKRRFRYLNKTTLNHWIEEK